MQQHAAEPNVFARDAARGDWGRDRRGYTWESFLWFSWFAVSHGDGGACAEHVEGRIHEAAPVKSCSGRAKARARGKKNSAVAERAAGAAPKSSQRSVSWGFHSSSKAEAGIAWDPVCVLGEGRNKR